MWIMAVKKEQKKHCGWLKHCSNTHYLTIKQVPSLLFVNLYIPFYIHYTMFYSILTLTNFYDSFTHIMYTYGFP